MQNSFQRRGNHKIYSSFHICHLVITASSIKRESLCVWNHTYSSGSVSLEMYVSIVWMAVSYKRKKPSESGCRQNPWLFINVILTYIKSLCLAYNIAPRKIAYKIKHWRRKHKEPSVLWTQWKTKSLQSFYSNNLKVNNNSNQHFSTTESKHIKFQTTGPNSRWRKE